MKHSAHRLLTLAIVAITVPLSSVFAQTDPPVRYEPGTLDRFVELADARIPLSPTDTAIRDQILRGVSYTTAVLYGGRTVKIMYLQAADLFQAEIQIPDLDMGKADAVAWFTDKGMSMEGICHLPLQIYISSDAAESLRGTGVTFNPLPSSEC